jgi:hypothetical protein
MFSEVRQMRRRVPFAFRQPLRMVGIHILELNDEQHKESLRLHRAGGLD